MNSLEIQLNQLFAGKKARRHERVMKYSRVALLLCVGYSQSIDRRVVFWSLFIVFFARLPTCFCVI